MVSNLHPQKEISPKRQDCYGPLLAEARRGYGYSPMYWQFYDLKQNPFSLTPDPAGFFPNPHHEDALATLIDSLHKHQGMGVLLGEAGLGKTLLLHVYLTLAQQRRYKSIYVASTDLAFRTLLQMLYEALGLDFATATLDMLLTACQQHSVILGIDDAHLMPTLTLKKLWTLAEYAASAGSILHIVLAGHPELDSTLDALALHHLTPAPIARYALSPFTPKESRAYIDHRLAQATTQAETVFTSRALTRIIKAAQGSPGTLNVLCTNALIAGFWAQQRPVSARVAREAIAQVQGSSPFQRRHWWSRV
jgi:general secretion pathway protein A